MQTSELEQIKNHLLGDEECINFRPSPNFKHMKKYLKSKFEEANSSPNHSSDRSTTPNSEEHETVQTWQASSVTMAQKVQPPLPPNSPPPQFLVVPKQEVEDEGYKDSSATQLQIKKDKDSVLPVDKKPEKVMCRQFARAMCNRGATCIYVHELILSQLPGVYTFCKNFQNSICNFPKCKFVHATVFEKEHFYRTGYLPPHTLAHLKESNSALGPPPAIQAAPAEATQAFSNPPSTVHPSVSTLATNGCALTESQARAAELSKGRRLSPKGFKSERNDIELGVGVTDVEKGDSKHFKCNVCESTQLRLQCTKANLELLRKQSTFIAKQKSQLKKWILRTKSVFELLGNQSSNNLLPFSDVRSGCRKIEKTKEMTIEQVEQMKMFVQVSGLQTADKMLVNQILNVLKKKPTEFRRALSNILGR